MRARSALLAALILAGCKKHQVATSSSEPSVTSEVARSSSLQSGGHERTFTYFLPPNASGSLPLVVGLHGRLGDGPSQERLSHFSKVGAREGFIVAFPDGFSRSWNDARGVTPAAKNGYDDVVFISDLIQWFVDKEHVDKDRVYVTGMSNGGFMTHTLGCKLADKIAAIATVAATFPGSDGSDCKPSHAMPTMMIMGDSDPIVPYGGGELGGRAAGSALSAKSSAELWARIDDCTGSPSTDALPDNDINDGTKTSLMQWSSCRDHSEVLLFTVIGGGHTWPGGPQYLNERLIGKVSRDFDASERIWQFFKDKKL